MDNLYPIICLSGKNDVVEYKKVSTDGLTFKIFRNIVKTSIPKFFKDSMVEDLGLFIKYRYDEKSSPIYLSLENGIIYGERKYYVDNTHYSGGNLLRMLHKFGYVVGFNRKRIIKRKKY